MSIGPQFHFERLWCESCSRGAENPCAECGAPPVRQVRCLHCLDWVEADAAVCLSCNEPPRALDEEEFIRERWKIKGYKPDQAAAMGFARGSASAASPKTVFDRQMALLAPAFNEIEFLQPYLSYPDWRDRTEKELLERFPLEKDAEKQLKKAVVPSFEKPLAALEEIRARSEISSHRDLAWLAMIKERGFETEQWDWLSTHFWWMMKDPLPHEGLTFEAGGVLTDPLNRELFLIFAHWRMRLPLKTFREDSPPRDRLNPAVVAKTALTLLKDPAPARWWAALLCSENPGTNGPETEEILQDAAFAPDPDIQLAVAFHRGKVADLRSVPPFVDDPKYAALSLLLPSGGSLVVGLNQAKTVSDLKPLLDRLADDDPAADAVRVLRERLAAERSPALWRTLAEKALSLNDPALWTEVLTASIDRGALVPLLSRWLAVPGRDFTAALQSELTRAGADWRGVLDQVRFPKPLGMDVLRPWSAASRGGGWEKSFVIFLSKQVSVAQSVAAFLRLVHLALNTEGDGWSAPSRQYALSQWLMLQRGSGKSGLPPLRWSAPAFEVYGLEPSAMVAALDDLADDPELSRNTTVEDWWVDFWSTATSPAPILGGRADPSRLASLQSRLRAVWKDPGRREIVRVAFLRADWALALESDTSGALRSELESYLAGVSDPSRALSLGFEARRILASLR